MVVSDALSRASLPEVCQEIPEKEVVFQVYSVVNNLPISDKKLLLFKKETESDEVLQILKEYTLNGWPANRELVEKSVLPYLNIQDEITYVNGILLKGSRIIVPASLRDDMKELLHQGHF